MLAGNSIHNDRLFIKRWWPEVDSLLHFGIAGRQQLEGGYADQNTGLNFIKPETHRAFEDIQGSIAELQLSGITTD